MTKEQKKARYNYIASRLLEHVEHRSTDQAADVMQVPVKSYTDSDQWSREIDLVFKRLPVLIGLSGELPGPGYYKAKELMGVPVLLTRLRDGSVRVMLNACSHRGMQVASGEGKCERFSCPYHAWLYSSDGSLQRVYGEDTYGDIDKAAMGLTQLPVYERAGLIFAVLTPGIEIDFEEYLGGMIEDVEELGCADWHYCGTRVIRGANWKIAYDGYLEGYHFAAAHPKTIHPRTYSNVMQFDAFGPHLMIGFAQKTIGNLKQVPPESWHEHENEGYDFVRAIFPNASIFVAPEITQVAQLLPGPTVGENTTVLHFIHRKAPVNDSERQALEGMMDWLRDVVQEEDYDLGLEVQKGLSSGAHEYVTFGRNELGNQHFHNWLTYYLEAEEGAEKPQLQRARAE